MRILLTILFVCLFSMVTPKPETHSKEEEEENDGFKETHEHDCNQYGVTCAHNEDCCSSMCAFKKCYCKDTKHDCEVDSQCCSGKCRGGECTRKKCRRAKDKCKLNKDCCNSVCVDHMCSCLKNDTECLHNNECCSDICSRGKCIDSVKRRKDEASYEVPSKPLINCKNEREFCDRNKDCCSLFCVNGKCKKSPKTKVSEENSYEVVIPKRPTGCMKSAEKCSKNAECCKGVCIDGHCGCVKAKNLCRAGKECCDGACVKGKCKVVDKNKIGTSSEDKLEEKHILGFETEWYGEKEIKEDKPVELPVGELKKPDDNDNAEEQDSKEKEPEDSTKSKEEEEHQETGNEWSKEKGRKASDEKELASAMNVEPEIEEEHSGHEMVVQNVHESCLTEKGKCQKNKDCCKGVCLSGHCASEVDQGEQELSATTVTTHSANKKTFKFVNEICKSSKDCISKKCEFKFCSCVHRGADCTNNVECCSEICTESHCGCRELGGYCLHDRECCDRHCNKFQCTTDQVEDPVNEWSSSEQPKLKSHRKEPHTTSRWYGMARSHHFGHV